MVIIPFINILIFLIVIFHITYHYEWYIDKNGIQVKIVWLLLLYRFIRLWNNSYRLSSNVKAIMYSTLNQWLIPYYLFCSNTCFWKLMHPIAPMYKYNTVCHKIHKFILLSNDYDDTTSSLFILLLFVAKCL